MECIILRVSLIAIPRWCGPIISKVVRNKGQAAIITTYWPSMHEDCILVNNRTDVWVASKRSERRTVQKKDVQYFASAARTRQVNKQFMIWPITFETVYNKAAVAEAPKCGRCFTLSDFCSLRYQLCFPFICFQIP